MSMIEATSCRVPWSIMPDVGVKREVLVQKELSKRPSSMTSAPIELRHAHVRVGSDDSTGYDSSGAGAEEIR